MPTPRDLFNEVKEHLILVGGIASGDDSVVGGAWRLDTNGDGRFDHSDVFASYGEEGDVPVVGDFDGDGIEEIAIYRNGLWVIDTNGNRQMDEGDRRFQYGEAGDLQVVGD
ncbi:MAG: hypothetical protein ACKO81_13535 [Planctomycetota bacterium]